MQRRKMVRQADISFASKMHLNRGLDLGTVIGGIQAAAQEAASKLGITCALVMNLDRSSSTEEGMVRCPVRSLSTRRLPPCLPP